MSKMLIGQQHWWQDCGEIARLVRYLHADDQYGPLDVDNCLEIVEKPWNWNAEYQEMRLEQTDPDMYRFGDHPNDMISDDSDLSDLLQASIDKARDRKAGV